MRSFLPMLPLAMLAAPALAQGPSPREPIAIPPELTDPAMAETLGRMSGTLTRALMNLPVGELAAAVEGREATPQEKNRTIRDMAGANDPYLEQRVERQVAESGVRMQGAMKAIASSMPAIMATMERMGEEIEREIGRATANMPQPGYPRR